jgi:hypothetical protein
VETLLLGVELPPESSGEEERLVAMVISTLREMTVYRGRETSINDCMFRWSSGNDPSSRLRVSIVHATGGMSVRRDHQVLLMMDSCFPGPSFALSHRRGKRDSMIRCRGADADGDTRRGHEAIKRHQRPVDYCLTAVVPSSPTGDDKYFSQ